MQEVLEQDVIEFEDQAYFENKTQHNFDKYPTAYYVNLINVAKIVE